MFSGTGMKHQEAEALTRHKTTKTDQTTIEDQTLGLYKANSISNEERKTRTTYILDWKLFNDRKRTGNLEITVLPHRRKPNMTNVQIPQKLSYPKKRNTRIVGSRHLQRNSQNPRLISKGIDVWFILHPYMGKYRILLLLFYNTSFISFPLTRL